MQNKEIEARFLEVDSKALIDRLTHLGAEDCGEDVLEEIIFYDKELKWRNSGQFVRLRKNNKGLFLAYKNNISVSVDGTEEIEFMVGDMNLAKIFLERIGLIAYRHQQKKRHSFKFGEVLVDIDTWPKIPTYIELEGSSEKQLKDAAQKLGFDWKNAIFENARIIIENRYHIPVGSMRWFTFDKFE